jgi:hypothetical protein
MAEFKIGIRGAIKKKICYAHSATNTQRINEFQWKIVQMRGNGNKSLSCKPKLCIRGQAHETEPGLLDGRPLGLGRSRTGVGPAPTTAPAVLRQKKSKLERVTPNNTDASLAPTGVTARTAPGKKGEIRWNPRPRGPKQDIAKTIRGAVETYDGFAITLLGFVTTLGPKEKQ